MNVNNPAVSKTTDVLNRFPDANREDRFRGFEDSGVDTFPRAGIHPTFLQETEFTDDTYNSFKVEAQTIYEKYFAEIESSIIGEGGLGLRHHLHLPFLCIDERYATQYDDAISVD